jgi:serine/threonine protein kinase
MQQPDKDKPAEKTPEKAPEKTGSESQLIRLEVGKKFGPWTVISKIDEGSFGSVYKVEDTQKKVAALKAESNDSTESVSTIKVEIAVLSAIHKDGERPYFPMLYHSAKRDKFCYMILTLLGDNLRTLKMCQSTETFTISTWIRIAIQGLYSLKMLHDEGFLHRDIKPANFCIGTNGKGRMLHLLDFGLARNYATQTSNGWQARRARTTVEFRGTIRYASPNVHCNLEQGRRDDIHSFIYLMVELNDSLPWKRERDKDKLKMDKLHIPDKVLLKNFPDELHFILPHLRNLTVYSRPDYKAYYNGMIGVMQRLEIKFDDPYDWETPEETKELCSKQEKMPHEDKSIATDFFASDPVRINGPPSKTKQKVPAKDKEDTSTRKSQGAKADKNEKNEVVKKPGVSSENVPDPTQVMKTPDSKH